MRLLDRATCGGRYVRLTAYLEAGELPIVSDILCHSPEQAKRLARELNQLHGIHVEPMKRTFQTCPKKDPRLPFLPIQPCEHADGHRGKCSWNGEDDPL